MRYPPDYCFPSGYRFLPTDEEVLTHLKQKIDNPKAYKCHMITVVPDFFKNSPEMFFNKYRSRRENSCYFFTSRDRKYKNGKRPDRRAGNGFYRASAKVQPVRNINGKKIGSKRSLVYYEGDHKNSVKTNWLMTEYVIDEHRIHINNQTNSMKLDDCVVYKIHYNHKKSKNRQLEQGESSNSQLEYQWEGEGGHEIETAGCTDGERQIIVMGTDCTKEVQDQGEMVNFVEQAKVETEMGNSVDKGKRILQEEEDDSVDPFLNLDQFLSWDMSVDPFFNTLMGSHNMPISSNGQFNNNFDFACQNESVHENGGYSFGHDEQLTNMQIHDQLNSLNNNASCSFNFQSTEGDGNQFDNSLASQSNGNDIAGYSYDEPAWNYAV